jgi:hypothetical protein
MAAGTGIGGGRVRQVTVSELPPWQLELVQLIVFAMIAQDSWPTRGYSAASADQAVVVWQKLQSRVVTKCGSRILLASGRVRRDRLRSRS